MSQSLQSVSSLQTTGQIHHGGLITLGKSALRLRTISANHISQGLVTQCDFLLSHRGVDRCRDDYGVSIEPTWCTLMYRTELWNLQTLCRQTKKNKPHCCNALIKFFHIMICLNFRKLESCCCITLRSSAPAPIFLWGKTNVYIYIFYSKVFFRGQKIQLTRR